MTLYVNNDNDVVADLFQLSRTFAVINSDTTMTVTLYDSTLSTISVGGSTSTLMQYQSGTDGRYIGVISSTVSLTTGSTYYTRVKNETYAFNVLLRHQALTRGL